MSRHGRYLLVVECCAPPPDHVPASTTDAAILTVGEWHTSMITAADAVLLAEDAACHHGDRWVVIDTRHHRILVEHSWSTNDLAHLMHGVELRPREDRRDYAVVPAVDLGHLDRTTSS